MKHQATTVGETALAALRRHPDRTAFSWSDGTGLSNTATYAQCLDAIGRTQAVFASAGLVRGDGIAVLAGNTVDTWLSAMAAWCSGLRLTYLHPRGSLADHLHQLGDARARALVVDVAAFADRAAEIRAATAVEHMLALGNADLDGPTIDLRAARKSAGAHSAADLGRVDDVLWLNYTGGTTGRPKGVAYRHASVLNQTRSILADFELPATPRYLAVAPITHVAGTKILPVLHRGGTVHLMDRFTPGGVLSAIERERINMTLLVPTMVYDLLDSPELEGADLSSLELALYGAAPMAPRRLAEAHERIGRVFAQLYGQSECYPISYLARAEHVGEDPDVLASCGFPVHAAQVRLLDESGADVPADEPGEICVRSASVMSEYWEQPEQTEAALAGGWLHTGDIGRVDDRGLIRIVDRKKDLVVTGGFNVFPREVEDVLASHPDVGAVAVYGLPDEHWGEAVTATVVLRAGATATADDLRSWVRGRKGGLHTPKQVFVVDGLPMTAVGKIDKKSLRDGPVDRGASRARHQF
ncbi:fatty-acyl-CoA synthase [Microbacterium terrae]|uniref:Long-chain-fatty-acid--CoA ligase n=1 Tax=Microbacterium terrae TaxID=69369 RepID=A0A0M2H242_9MICO|nr:AMP-binding protein [Microbacterium terrae]KJL37519.1 Long-chain-fatty-acid--CoA ligase [Microbacterium terrae]MBP1076348.1 fatty-acyl-CoA synthase [Microbacterium terrae]GLJ97172.1 acyl-CoA synthetase [Microbacterium terrae]